jgi:uncharacterized protein YbjT (DUF2867 family)
MRVVIAGGHGKIALRLERMLAGRGDTAVGLVRNPAHAADLDAAGAVPAVVDLERATAADLAGHLAGADAAVFAAGAGPGSGTDRKDTVDRAAATLLADAAVAAGVRRYLLVSSTGVQRAEDPGLAADVGDVFAAYLRAKAAAEREVAERDLDLTVLRPGPLTDDLGAGTVRLAPPPLDRVAVTRDDVAAVLLALLDEPGTGGRTLELMGGATPIATAVAAMTR